jgi:hypothetical protein
VRDRRRDGPALRASGTADGLADVIGKRLRSDGQTRPANRLADATGEAVCDRVVERDRAVEYVQVPSPGDDDFGRVERSVGGVLDRARPRPSAAARISIQRDPESVQHAIASSCSAVHQPCHTPSSLGLQLRCPHTSTRRSAPAIVLQRPRTSTPRLRHGAPARRSPDPALAPKPQPASAQHQPTTGVCTAPTHDRRLHSTKPCPALRRSGTRVAGLPPARTRRRSDQRPSSARCGEAWHGHWPLTAKRCKHVIR